MKTTIDSAGRLIIPRDARREAGLEPGMTLSVSVRNGVIEIQPAPRAVKLVKKGRLTVAIPESEAVALNGETVERTRDKLRMDRSS